MEDFENEVVAINAQSVTEKKEKWPIKEMVISFLATSKIWAWVEKIIEFINSDYDNTWRLILNRILTREIWIILAVVIYFAMNKYKINELSKSIILYFVLLIAAHVVTWVIEGGVSFNLNFIISYTVLYAILTGAVNAKDHFKTKIKEKEE